MNSIEDDLFALVQGIRGAGAKELVQRRAALEAKLETMVRCALRTGAGAPEVVRWVRAALPRVTGARIGAPAAEQAAPILARMLCRTLIHERRQPQYATGPAAHETVIA